MDDESALVMMNNKNQIRQNNADSNQRHPADSERTSHSKSPFRHDMRRMNSQSPSQDEPSGSRKSVTVHSQTIESIASTSPYLSPTTTPSPSGSPSSRSCTPSLLVNTVVSSSPLSLGTSAVAQSDSRHYHHHSYSSHHQSNDASHHGEIAAPKPIQSNRSSFHEHQSIDAGLRSMLLSGEDQLRSRHSTAACMSTGCNTVVSHDSCHQVSSHNNYYKQAHHQHQYSQAHQPTNWGTQMSAAVESPGSQADSFSPSSISSSQRAESGHCYHQHSMGQSQSSVTMSVGQNIWCPTSSTQPVPPQVTQCAIPVPEAAQLGNSSPKYNNSNNITLQRSKTPMDPVHDSSASTISQKLLDTADWLAHMSPVDALKILEILQQHVISQANLVRPDSPLPSKDQTPYTFAGSTPYMSGTPNVPSPVNTPPPLVSSTSSLHGSSKTIGAPNRILHETDFGTGIVGAGSMFSQSRPAFLQTNQNASQLFPTKQPYRHHLTRTPSPRMFMNANQAHRQNLQPGFLGSESNAFAYPKGYTHFQPHFQSQNQQQQHHQQHHHEKGKVPDEIDWGLLEDIPGWLRSLRLHKYTDIFTGSVPQSVIDKHNLVPAAMRDEQGLSNVHVPWSWRVMIKLSDPELEELGVHALGARRKMLKVFDKVQEELQFTKSNVELMQ